MEKTLPLEERSINQIYLESQETCIYKIPVYQRNYAWEEDEITALVKDVYDSMQKDAKKPYYIGTLVTYKRGENEYEVIDGQQRLTTIYLILKALGIENIPNKLTYTARRASAETIKRLPDFGEEVDQGIRNGFRFAANAINNIVNNKELKAFKQYFLHQVHIIHYKVPKDVDLNHYFEVMNSRGEQLEKHEIVKSILSQHLKDKTELATFSRVWEACSEMNIYIQQTFPAPMVFGNKLDDFCIEDFCEIPAQNESEGKETILNLLSHPTGKAEERDDTSQADKFQPIINFPNFLLIVLKLTMMYYDEFDPTDFTLDDKELLTEFEKAMKKVDDRTDFAKFFAFNLLKAKYLLDNYVVHHVMNAKEQTGDNPWKLQYFYKENSRRQYPKNLLGNTDEQDELVHLLSMFEVSFTPKQRKNYLFYCLAHLFENPDESVYLQFARDLADKYFFGIYLNRACLNERNQPAPNAFDNAIIKDGELCLEIDENADYRRQFNEIYQPGRSDISLFVFNYTDYRLWKKYADEMRGNKTKKGSAERSRFFAELGCNDFELEPFNNFYFSRTRKSLEHYFPQAKAVKDSDAQTGDVTTTQINCFGNFAMIGAEANSSGSNWDPKTKLDHYTDGKSDPVSVASLKFRIMMQMCQDNNALMLTGNLDRAKGMEWNAEDIQIHQTKMLDVILL